MVPHEFVELLEGAFIEQQVHALARAELAFLVLALAAFCAAASFGFGVAAAKLFKAVEMFAVFDWFWSAHMGSQYRLFAPPRQAQRNSFGLLLPPIRKSYQIVSKQVSRSFNRGTVD
jgi:hypothetical protein